MNSSSLRLARFSGARVSSKQISSSTSPKSRREGSTWKWPALRCSPSALRGSASPKTRLGVAHAGRQFPAVLDSLRSGDVHLSGLRVLVPHLTAESHRQVLARAAGKSKREIEELVAALAPRPPVPDAIRKLPGSTPSETAQLALAPAAARPAKRPRAIAPLSE